MSVNINFPNFIEVNELDTSDATATESDIAVGKTAYVNGVKVIGTKDWVDTSDATATASDIAVGKTAYVNDVKITGTKEDVEPDAELISNISSATGSNGKSSVDRMIKTISIPSGTTKIPNYAFTHCTSLRKVTIPNTVTSIGVDAFSYCRNLENITIPNSITNIYGTAFSNCSSLAHIYYKGTEEQWNAISKTSGWNISMGSNVTGGTVIHYNS